MVWRLSEHSRDGTEGTMVSMETTVSKPVACHKTFAGSLKAMG